MGTELERRGVELPLPLWSTHAIDHTPDLIGDVHREYLEAGADIITACTFRTNRRALERVGRGDEARSLTTRAVEIACNARDAINRAAVVAGSVAPLEDCYEPDLAPPSDVALEEHAEMVHDLISAGADIVLIETMNTRREAMAALSAAREAAPGRFMISFCPKPDGPPGVLRRGTSLADILGDFTDARAVGVNCIPVESIEANVRLMRALLPETVEIIAYGNSGHVAEDDTWDASGAMDPEAYATYARRWIDAGATIVGGCCGTRPATIRALR